VVKDRAATQTPLKLKKAYYSLGYAARLWKKLRRDRESITTPPKLKKELKKESSNPDIPEAIERVLQPVLG
jgi:hypothetical protein